MTVIVSDSTAPIRAQRTASSNSLLVTIGPKLNRAAWRAAPKPLGPKGGEVQAARAMFEVLRAKGQS